MTLRIVLLVLFTLEIIQDMIEIYFINKQRQKPLPPEVSDIYDQKRYTTFLSYKRDLQKSLMISHFLHMIPKAIFLLTPYYQWIETIANSHMILITIYTFGIDMFISSLIDFCIDYYNCFSIEEKYGLNKKTLRLFIQDYLKELMMNIIMMSVLFAFIIYVCENIYQWLSNISHPLFLVLGIDVGIVFVVIFLTMASFIFLKLQYHFTDMPECQLRTDIENILKACKKKIHKIKIYDESKKSVGKNAFLLNVGIYREISIADNFINKNDHNELLAVLSHEVGHLRHHKNIYDYISYAFMFGLFLIVNVLILHPQLISHFNQYICQSFQLQQTNYPLTIIVFSELITWFLKIFNIFSNYHSRVNEYEADCYAVEMGYGEELITTFKTLSSDELVDVNPSLYMEIMYYDHPGMYRRIKAIHEAMDKKVQNEKI